MGEPERVALYGGTFDPVHDGHLAVARGLSKLFGFGEVLFIPAHHAPHKRGTPPTSPWHRYAMLALATQGEPGFRVSPVELDAPERPYTVETVGRLRAESGGGRRLFFVMGADSWEEITSWREWERLLGMTDTVVVTRPGHETGAGHVPEGVRARVVDLRGAGREEAERALVSSAGPGIFLSDAVNVGVSSTEVRRALRGSRGGAADGLPLAPAVIEYIRKYGLYTDNA